jgi:hypothetical protein
VVSGLTVNVSNSAFSGAVMDSSEGDVDLSDFGISLTSVTADSIVEGTLDGLLRAKDCTFATALVNITADGFVGGLSWVVAAEGTTSAPVMVRLAGNNCSLVDETLADILRPSPKTPVGIEVLGDNNSIGGMAIKDVAAGGTAVRINAAAAGTVLHDLSVSGSGAALSDQATGTVLQGFTATINGASGQASAVTLGAKAVVDGLAVNVSNSTFSGPVVDGSAEIQNNGLQLFDIRHNGGLHPELWKPTSFLGMPGCSVSAKNCTLATPSSRSPATASFGGSVQALGTTSARSWSAWRATIAA